MSDAPLDKIEIECVDKLDRGLSYAENCFETFRVINGAIFQWSAHWQRLSQGMAAFGITLQPSWEEDIHNTCLTKAENTAHDCLLRLTISGGKASWGLFQQVSPTAWIQVIPFKEVQVGKHLQSVEYPFHLQHKAAKFTSDYAETLRATQLWQTEQPNIHPSSFLICKQGNIISGLTANIALYIDDKWVTPSGEGILSGTLRQFFIEKNLIHPCTCPTSLLQQAEAIALMNAGTFLQPVQSIDKHVLDTNHPAIHVLVTVLKAEHGTP